jgi:predicted Zn-dependent peptidase
MASHLFKKLREDLGLVYFVHSHISTFLDQGLWLIEASSEIQSMPEVIEIIFSEVKKLQTKSFPASWFRAQKKLLRGQVLLGAEDLENRMQSLALNELIFEQYRNPEDYLNKFEKVKEAEVRSFIKERINFSRCAVVLYGQKAKEFKPFLENLIEMNL